VYTGKYGIVRCGHLQKEEIIDLLNSLQNEKFRLKTLKTSGTIKKLKKEINSF
ncbi:MAG: Rpp14/Pop5 family protein, partial [Thermoplasmata archaeon]|nr:Rpp14/Pop5 family protein [Thermoplasmata archaeon]